MCKFSHLHVHTQYSLLDDAASIDSLYKKAAADNMPALAITDHGNMFGVFDFVNQAWKNTRTIGKDANGKEITEPVVKPIVGCEFYVVEDRFKKSFSKKQKDERYHQVLLAKNATGYKNLVKLTSLGFIEGMYSKYPRIDKSLIEQYHEGLIATTCCIGAYVPQTILHEDEQKAEQEFKWWLDMFGEDYYIEIQRHNIHEQLKINETLLRFAKKYNVPVIATNDSHYTDKDDYNAHDILLCINTGEKQSTPGFDDFVNDDTQIKNRRFKFPNDQFYLKTTEEMKLLFNDIPESIDNTNAIVDKIEVLNLKKDILLPAFPLPKEFKIHTDDNLNQWEYLQHLTREGAKIRYADLTPEIQERIDFELFTIKTMGFAGYFLIVSDFIKAGRNMGVFVGPGRGSAAGSMVAYCIGITNIDPIKYNLLFERFLNPDRKSMPDIDTDFDDEGRQKVIDYVVDKYGKNQVAQIITYGTMAAKMSIKDVARVMDLPLAESNILAKMVPDRPGTDLGRVLQAPLTKKDGEKSLEEKEGLGGEDLENVKRLREIYKGNDLRAQVLKEAERLEGSVRNTGIHAAGIIIAPKDLTDLIPVATAKDSDLWVTQIEGNIIEDAGVIKMDFLGLKTLSILKTALELIKQNHGVEIEIDEIPLDDERTYLLYQRGETNATFQFESPGMQKYLRELKPDKFADLIAMNALYRPGPMSYIPQYVARKHGREEVKYDLEGMNDYLEETYGITVYQEQVMLLSQSLAGFSKGDADVLRKAMGKKQKSVLDKMKAQFIAGATAKGHAKEPLEKVWTDWEAFAQYAFNKSHSTCYAFVAYQTAFLKAHYPSEYMAAVLNHAGSIEKITFYMEECKRMGLKVLGPDINESKKGFAVNQKGEIRFGLGGLKGVGENAIENLIEEREKAGFYTNIFDFIKRVNQRAVNKKSIESLVYSGAFDCFTDMHRAQFFHIGTNETKPNIERIIQFGNVFQTNKTQGSNSLFGDAAMPEIAVPKLPNCEPWTLTEKLDYNLEKAKKQFEQVKPMLRSMEYWFGAYPFYEDGYKLVESPHLGMEHQSAVAYGNKYQNGYLGRDLSGAGWGLKWDFIIVHESGHEWFANNITTNDLADMWVHEGFTSFSETLFIDYWYGKQAGNEYCVGVRRNIGNKTNIIGYYGVNKEGSGDMYYKGENMLQTIRHAINDDVKFRSILRGLNKTFYHKTVTSKQVENYISQQAGYNFETVFDQYLRTVNIPVLEFREENNGIQYKYTNVVDGFNLPIILNDGTKIIPQKDKWQTLTSATGWNAEDIQKQFYLTVKKATNP